MIHIPFTVKVRSAFEWINQKSGGVISIFLTTIKQFDKQHGAEAAGSIAYFGVFSLFPILLFLVSVLGYFLEKIGSPIEIALLITQAIPISRNLVYSNLVQILGAHKLGGIIGLVGLLWAGSSVFSTISRNINRAWPNAQSRNLFEHRLFAFLMIFVLLLLVASWLITNLIVNLMPRIIVPFLGEVSIFENHFRNDLYGFIPLLIAFLILFGLYRWIPNTHVRWREAFWGAITAAILMDLSTQLFTWFISSGMASFDVIYGSLGTGIALLAWAYICAVIIILGAHLCAAIAIVKRFPVEI